MTNRQGRRIYWVLGLVAIIAAGLTSRQFSFIPYWVGDALWASMIYAGLRILFPVAKAKRIALAAWLFCLVVECSQLYQAPWINQIRHTTIGALVLGQGFLWTDLLAYAIGIFIMYLSDYFHTNVYCARKESDQNAKA